MSAHRLPESFGDLEQFAARWAPSTENERHARRQTSTMAELRSFNTTWAPPCGLAMNPSVAKTASSVR
jgi:hypothetical protein